MIIKNVFEAGTELAASTPLYSAPVDLNSADWTRDAQGYGSVEAALPEGVEIQGLLLGSITGVAWRVFGDFWLSGEGDSVVVVTIPPCAKIKIAVVAEVGFTLPDVTLCII